MKYGRFGEFTACSNYPTCKYVKQKTIGVKCPECADGEVVERRSKRGRTFYGCHLYPDCKFVAWGKPVAEKCPKCGSPYLVEKWLKAGGFWQCPNGSPGDLRPGRWDRRSVSVVCRCPGESALVAPPGRILTLLYAIKL